METDLVLFTLETVLQEFIQHIELNHLFTKEDRLLVGVSGGIDSVVLTDLLAKGGYSFSIAHCNFKLRGSESDQDEEFVQNLASIYHRDYYSQSFDTLAIASGRGISIEMAARELRYDWFEHVRLQHNFSWIVVAHHRDDQIETFFLNLSRGTGIAGLTGMKSVNGVIVRPLLFASRNEIERYAADLQLAFREDSSNLSTVYLRNKIRHKILPLMEELNPSFRNNLFQTMTHLGESACIYSDMVKQVSETLIHTSANGSVELSIEQLKRLNPLRAYLFEFLKPFHFNGEVISELIKALEGQPGKMFYSATHRAVVDRKVIIVEEIKSETYPGYLIYEDTREILEPIELSLETVVGLEQERLNPASSIAYLDKDRLTFPLVLRKWQQGDTFQPLGMTGMKKLSDYFIDRKLSIPEKEAIWVLASGEEIAWIVNHRLDHRYRITEKTRNILVLKYGS